MRAAAPAPLSPSSKEQAPRRGPAPARGEEAEERRQQLEERRAPPGLEAGSQGGRHRLSRGAGAAPGAGEWRGSRSRGTEGRWTRGKQRENQEGARLRLPSSRGGPDAERGIESNLHLQAGGKPRKGAARRQACGPGAAG